jgi:single-stranded DNA-binding protein
MFILINGALFRDPVARMSKANKQFVTALIKAGTPTDTQWVNVVCFDALAQSELLRLKAGDAISVQGLARVSVFQDKAGEHRASIDVTAFHILALRQPKRKKQESEPERTAPDYDNGWN